MPHIHREKSTASVGIIAPHQNISLSSSPISSISSSAEQIETTSIKKTVHGRYIPIATMLADHNP